MSYKHYPVQQAATCAGTTFVTMSLVDLLAHLGPTGMLVVGLLSYAAWKHGPELYEQVRGILPPPASSAEEDTPPETARRSWVDRALGRYPAAENHEEDPMLVPEEDDEEEEASPDTLEVGDLRPHADSVFSHRLVILGMPGVGKSNLIAVLTEELGQFDAPLIVFDHKPEYDPLCERPYLSYPAKMNARNLTPYNAVAMGQHIMAERLHAVIDLTSYQDD